MAKRWGLGPPIDRNGWWRSGTLDTWPVAIKVVPERRHYGDHRPYPDPPARLADLTGPTAGSIELPITIDWGPSGSMTLAATPIAVSSTNGYCEKPPRTEEVSRYVNGAILVEVWPRLWLSPAGASPLGRTLP